MNKNKKEITYERFHKFAKFQKRIINENNFTYRHIIYYINKFLKPPQEILDIGCGVGTLCLYYSSRGNKVLGIDISQKAVNSANNSAKLLGLNNAKFEKMEFPVKIPRDKFNFIIFTEVIEHLEDDELALRKIYLLLKKGGIVFISTPSQNAPLHRLGMTKNFDKKVGHLRRYTLNQLMNKSQKCGFTVLKTAKTEGVIRNFLFINPIGGKFVRFIKFFLSDLATYVDYLSLKLFGESNLFVILQKP